MKEIKGFENYLISEDGDVYRKGKNKPLNKWIDNTGYYQVILYKNGKRHYKRVHRLIAEAYLPNPENLPQVNHKDGIKTNTYLSNLEWMTNSENTKHGYDNNLYHTKHRSCGVDVYEKGTTKLLFHFESIRKLSETLGLNRKSVSNILNGSKKTNNYPYDFKYSD